MSVPVQQQRRRQLLNVGTAAHVDAVVELRVKHEPCVLSGICAYTEFIVWPPLHVSPAPVVATASSATLNTALRRSTWQLRPSALHVVSHDSAAGLKVQRERRCAVMVGAPVGDDVVGTAVGAAVGTALGAVVGDAVVGAAVGAAVVGALDGVVVGAAVGTDEVGLAEGAADGDVDGALVGSAVVGAAVGAALGGVGPSVGADVVGDAVGSAVDGALDGLDVGASVGTDVVGDAVGSAVDGALDGLDVGTAVVGTMLGACVGELVGAPVGSSVPSAHAKSWLSCQFAKPQSASETGQSTAGSSFAFVQQQRRRSWVSGTFAAHIAAGPELLNSPTHARLGWSTFGEAY